MGGLLQNVINVITCSYGMKLREPSMQFAADHTRLVIATIYNNNKRRQLN